MSYCIPLLFFTFYFLFLPHKQWQEPEEARPPTKKWRLYVFKGDAAVGACAASYLLMLGLLLVLFVGVVTVCC